VRHELPPTDEAGLSFDVSPALSSFTTLAQDDDGRGWFNGRADAGDVTGLGAESFVG